MKSKIDPSVLAQIAAGASLKTEKVQSHVGDIRVVDIVPNPHQPRMSLDPLIVRDLAESIRLHGLIQPITVTRSESGYTLISGHTRLEAHRILGRDTIRANIIEADDDDLALLALIENVQRTDLHPLEIALSLSREPFLSMRDDHIAAALGYSVTKVRNIKSILRLSHQVQSHIIKNRPQIGIDILVEIQKLDPNKHYWYYADYLEGKIDRAGIRAVIRSQNLQETIKTPELISRHANTIKIDCNAITDIHIREEFDRELAILLAKYKSAGGSEIK